MPQTQSSDSLIKDIFKTRATPRQKISSIFSRLEPPSKTAPAGFSKNTRAENYPAAIEFGSSSAKLLQLAKTINGYEVAKTAFIPSGTYNQQQSVSVMRDSLRMLVDSYGLSGEVVSSFSINKVGIVTYTLPVMPLSEIGQAITWKLKQNPPAGATFESVSFDYLHSIHSRDNLNKELKIIVFVVAKEAIMEQMMLFKEFSLDLIAIEPQPYSVLSALFWQGRIKQEETVLVLDLGGSQSSIMIVHAGQPYLIRQLAVSGNVMTEAIANYNQIDWQKAENLKKTEGLKYWPPVENSEAMCLPALSSQLENLAVDVEHTFKYFSHQLMKSQVASYNRIIICGGSSGLFNFKPYLEDRLGAPVDIFSPFDSPNILLKQALNREVKENTYGFWGAMGLAARYIE